MWVAKDLEGMDLLALVNLDVEPFLLCFCAFFSYKNKELNSYVLTSRCTSKESLPGVMYLKIFLSRIVLKYHCQTNISLPFPMSGEAANKLYLEVQDSSPAFISLPLKGGTKCTSVG